MKKKHKQRHQRKPKANREQRRNRAEQLESTSSRSFQFVDRSGKVHGLKSRAPAEQPSGQQLRVKQINRKEPTPEKNSTLDTLTARVDKTRSGAAFLIFADSALEDVFVPPHMARDLFHGDRVQVSIKNKSEISGLRVLEHRMREVFGRYVSKHLVVYETRKTQQEIKISKIEGNPKPGEWVRVKLDFTKKNTKGFSGDIVEVLGRDLPPEIDLDLISGEFGLEENHSDAAVKEAEALRLHIPGSDLQNREDLRGLDFVTIDGATARDFDDAVYVEKASGGKFILWVAIADVSHYVKPGTELDKEAYKRATSVYFPERAFHMLPAALSENLCSLRPKEPRLALVSKMLISHDGEIQKIEVMEAVIESKRRCTYEEVQQEMPAPGTKDGFFKLHFELYRILRTARQKRGSIDFELPEFQVQVDYRGEPTAVVLRERFDAHRLIEEFMIAANEAVTQWTLKRKFPFVYRVHGTPDPKALDRFATQAAAMGIDVRFDGEEPKPIEMADIVRRLVGHPAEKMLNFALLRSMRQAIYSAEHDIHFGLASEAYTHFTSPIRRYPDLMVHRVLRQLIQLEKRAQEKPSQKEIDRLQKHLEEATEHCSYRERLAADAERECLRIKQVRMMTKHVGETFDATVIGMTEKGLFCQISEPYVEGFLPRESLPLDRWEFNEDRMMFYGKKPKHSFKISDPIKIRVANADLQRRTIEFTHSSVGLPPQRNRSWKS